MSLILDREISHLKKQLLMLGAVVEENVMRAARAIQQRDEIMAAEVFEKDRLVDSLEVQTEEECLKILALHQPVATDLRYIVAALKINNDLERIGDLAVSLAKNAKYLFHEAQPVMALHLDDMTERVQSALRMSLDAMIQVRPDLARRVLAEERIIDDLHNDNKELLYNAMREQPQYLRSFLHLLQISRRLERIADHATNMAEDVLYMVEGDIVRHETMEA